MRLRKRILFLTFLVLSSFSGPDTLRNRILQSLDTFNAKFPQEKVYLQFDKDYYAGGETIWFKAYTLLQEGPTTLSNNLYVELMDRSGLILRRDILPIRDGVSSGSFRLPQDFHPGEYRIRAYTAWMMNFNQDLFFHRDLLVFRTNPGGYGSDTIQAQDNTLSRLDITEPAHFSVQFFPEGGNLVDGLSSVVAFKALGSDGRPVDIKGRIRDNTGQIIATVHSIHDGMGEFTLKPLAGHTYMGDFTLAGTSAKAFALPQSLARGVLLHVVPDLGSSRLFFSITRSPEDKTDLDRFELVAQMEDQPVYIAAIDFSRGLTGGMIPLGNLPAGILQITLLDSTLNPLAERLAFVDHFHPIPLKLDMTRLGMNPREQNIWHLSTPDTLLGNYSLSVTDADQVSPHPLQDNIISNLLMNSDLRGNIYHAGWYFRNEDTATRRALDLVMLTNGWTRFSWERILRDQYPVIHFPAENDKLYIRGQSITMNGGKVNMVIRDPADTTTEFITAPMNNLGEFYVGGLSFHDTALIYFQGANGKESNFNNDVRINGSFTDNLAKAPLEGPLLPPLLPQESPLNHYLSLVGDMNRVHQMILSRGILLQEVTVSAQRISTVQKLDDEYTSGTFRFGDAVSFDMNHENSGYQNVLLFLEGRVAGLMVSGDPNNPTVSWQGGTPALYLNEVPIDAAYLSTIPVSEIALVKVFRPPFMGGFNGAHGAIAVYTRKGGDYASSQPGLTRTRKLGYTLVKEFYSPDYAQPSQGNDLPDERTTLYWDPLIHTAPGQPATIRFYNNDLTRRFHVVLEGMDQQGRLGRIDTVLTAAP